ncbi:hypothetical protein ABZZ17_23790 [Streptomyces sp. NPDC006512]|uniref:hypothetical protein n=1 Tax=Streptomyces sp. NPDC006512 TaxID=3154307 RepID=UPI0033BA8F22
MSRTARTATLIAAVGVTAMLSTGAHSLAFPVTAKTSTGPGVIGWDSVQAAGVGFAAPSGEASQVIGWD